MTIANNLLKYQINLLKYVAGQALIIQCYANIIKCQFNDVGHFNKVTIDNHIKIGVSFIQPYNESASVIAIKSDTRTVLTVRKELGSENSLLSCINAVRIGTFGHP